MNLPLWRNTLDGTGMTRPAIDRTRGLGRFQQELETFALAKLRENKDMEHFE